LARNIERDRETDAELRNEGWEVARYWEHEEPLEIAEDIRRRLEAVPRSAREKNLHLRGTGD